MSKKAKTIAPNSKSYLLKIIFARMNRGVLLDIVVFLLNLFLMRYLAREFVKTIQWAAAGDFLAEITIFLVFIAVFILPPAGATLKRWRFHERFRAGNRESPKPEDVMAGCLFNPIVFFCLNIFIFSVVNAFIFRFLVGDSIEEHGGIFVSSLFLGIGLMILQTWLVYRYFAPPKKKPGKFLQRPAAENLGDVCFYLNMILFQLFWNFITIIPFNRVFGFGEFAGRLFILCFISLLVYFPPRMFYLIEDGKRTRTWLMILLANAPVIYRILVGTESNANW